MLVSRQLGFKNSVYNGKCKNTAVQFMILTSDCHTEVMHKRSENYCDYAVRKRAVFFVLQACRYFCLVQNLKHLKRIKSNGAHVNGTVIVITEADNRDVIRVILNCLNFRICNESL